MPSNGIYLILCDIMYSSTVIANLNLALICTNHETYILQAYYYDRGWYYMMLESISKFSYGKYNFIFPLSLMWLVTTLIYLNM